MIETTAIVKESSHFGNGYCRLKIEVEQLDVLPGQFAMLKPAGLEEPLLRRAMAFYTVETVNNKTLAEFIFHEIGRGTLALGRLRRGESVYFLGPLGKSFSTEPAKQHSKALIVGGGVGSPALLMLAKQLQGLSIQTEIFLGARSQQDLIGVEDFGSLGFPVSISTDDGSVGEKGFVTSPLERALLHSSDAVVYTCGPDPMMRRVVEIANRQKVQVFASLEARMACGFGVCVGCVVETKVSQQETTYSRVCVEGPVFDGCEVVWE